jgi:hypothetical protein
MCSPLCSQLCSKLVSQQPAASSARERYLGADVQDSGNCAENRSGVLLHGAKTKKAKMLQNEQKNQSRCNFTNFGVNRSSVSSQMIHKIFRRPDPKEQGFS